jgi:hypothetical protein
MWRVAVLLVILVAVVFLVWTKSSSFTLKEIPKTIWTFSKALDAVAEASAAHGEGFSYDIRGDLVHVEKKAQGAQRRHLARRHLAKKASA